MNKTGKIEGTVSLKDGIDPVGTDVYIPGTSFTAKADHDGYFKIFYLPADTYTLRYERTDYSAVEIANIVVEKGETTTLGDVELGFDSGAISGIVRSETSALVDGATVLASSVTTPGYVENTVTNAGGFYILSGLREDTFNLTFSKPGYSTEIVNGIAVVKEQTTVQDATLDINSGTIKGQVTSGGPGLPNATVLATHLTISNLTYNTVTNALGNYTLGGLEPGDYDLDFMAVGYSSAQITGVTVTVGATVSGQDTDLTPATDYISGTVTLEGESDHAGVTVTATHTTLTNVVYSAVSNSDGDYFIINPTPGDYLVFASRPNYASPPATEITVSGGTPVTGVNIPLEKAKGYVTGFVLLEGQGRPFGLQRLYRGDRLRLLDRCYRLLLDVRADRQLPGGRDGEQALLSSADLRRQPDGTAGPDLRRAVIYPGHDP
jgi:hypothetical protein